MSIRVFNAQAEVANLKQQQRIRRKPRPSRLTRFKGELLALYANGATVADLQRWLRKHGIKVAYSTISRWLAKYG